MRSGSRWTGRRAPELVVLAVGIGVAGVLVLLHIAVPRTPWAPQWRDPESDVNIYFDLGREQNLPTWVNVSILLLAAVAAGLAAFLARAANDRAAWPWAGFALVCAALSLDDLSSLHERLHALGVRIGGGSGLTYAAWLVPGLAGAAVVVVAMALLYWRVGRRARVLLVAGVGFLLIGAFGLEALGNAVLEAQGHTRSYAYYLVLEEFLEAVGAVFLLAAPFAQLRIGRSGPEWQVAYRSAARESVARESAARAADRDQTAR